MVMLNRSRRFLKVSLAGGLLLLGVAPTLLAAAETAPSKRALQTQPLLDGLRRTGEQLGGSVERTTGALTAGLDRTVTQLGDGVRETVATTGQGLTDTAARLSAASTELALRLNGRYLETVDGSEGLEIAVVHQGVGRRVIVLRPTVPSAAPAPALLLLHYANGTPEQMANLARISRLAAERGAWIILPEAVNGQWREDPNGLDAVDDVGFLERVLAEVLQSYPIDAERVYVAGMSKGGFMATRMVCQSEFPFAGIALVAASLRRQQDLQCPQARPLPMIVFAGTQDTIVPYKGRLGLLSANAHYDRWSALNGCPRASETTRSLPRTARDGTSLRLRSNADCASGRGVSLYTVEKGGHTWPGSIVVYGVSVGRITQQIDASQVLWDFLEADGAP